MSKRDDLIAVYAADLQEKCGVTPNMELLTKVVIDCVVLDHSQNENRLKILNFSHAILFTKLKLFTMFSISIHFVQFIK